MNQKGFVLMVVVAGIIVALLGTVGYFSITHDRTPRTSFFENPINNFPNEVLPPQAREVGLMNNTQKLPERNKTQSVSQTQHFNPFSRPSKTPCPTPFVFDLPIDLNKATSILYPGQVRGGDFKAHGGFRFDTSRPEEITVVAPIDASVVVGARYPVSGEIQYTLEFEHPCGIRYRLGHLLTLTPKFQAIAELFPLPTTLDSRTTEVYPPIEVRKGEVIATAVGLTGSGAGGTGRVNTFLDWGVYDYRQKNEIAKDPSWAASHTSDTYQYAVCWFDWISAEHRAQVLALPSSDGISGTKSDYCK